MSHQGRHHLVVVGCDPPVARDRKELDPFVKQTSDVTERGATHQDCVRLDHARDVVLDVESNVKVQGFILHEEHSGSLRIALGSPETNLRAVSGSVRRKALSNLQFRCQVGHQ